MASEMSFAARADDEFDRDPHLTLEDVQERVDNWLKRIKELYQDVSTWGVKNGWRLDEVGSVPMNEPFMRDFGVKQRDQPALRLDGDGGRYALFKPKGLWVIGANGRIDLYTAKGVFIIVDEAPTFEAPQWTIYRSDSEREGRSFDPSLIEELA